MNAVSECLHFNIYTHKNLITTYHNLHPDFPKAVKQHHTFEIIMNSIELIETILLNPVCKNYNKAMEKCLWSSAMLDKWPLFCESWQFLAIVDKA